MIKQIAFISLAALALTACNSGGEPAAVQDQGTSTVVQDQAVPPEATAAMEQSDAMLESSTISFDGTVFSPKSLTVKAGTTVTIKNTGTKSLAFNSSPHPAHTDTPELNLNAIAPGASKTVTLTKPGTYKYHNHLDSSQFGSIVVE